MKLPHTYTKNFTPFEQTIYLALIYIDDGDGGSVQNHNHDYITKAKKKLIRRYLADQRLTFSLIRIC